MQKVPKGRPFINRRCNLWTKNGTNCSKVPKGRPFINRRFQPTVMHKTFAPLASSTLRLCVKKNLTTKEHKGFTKEHKEKLKLKTEN